MNGAGAHWIGPSRRAWIAWLMAAVLVAALAASLGRGAPASAAGERAGAAAPSAKQPHSAAGSRLFGIVLQGGLSAAQQARLKQLNPASVRFLLLWDKVQRAAGQCTPNSNAVCDWSSIDAQVGAAAAAGARPLPFLYGGPSVLGLDTYTPPLTPAARAAWQAFLRAAAQRYGPGGTYWQGPFQAAFPGAKTKPITYWQVWNEPGSPTYFSPNPNVRKLVQLLEISRAAIRAVNARAKIVLPGLFSGGNRPNARGRIAAAPYLEKLYKVKGAEKYFDIVALHPYSSDVKGVLAQARAVRDAMREGGDARTKLWITEVGWASNINKKSLIAKGLQGQARTLRAAFKALLREQRELRLGAVQWFSLEDVPRANSSCQNCPFTGLVRTNASKKPSFGAFQSFTR